MTNYREILRLDSLELNKTQISEACGCSRTTVIQTLRLAKENGLKYPLADSMSENSWPICFFRQPPESLSSGCQTMSMFTENSRKTALR